MPPLFSGVVQVTGENDSGKTLFCFPKGVPVEKIAFIDDDVKGSAIVRDVLNSGRKFALYCNLTKETAGMRELETHAHCLSIVEKLEKIKPEVIAWDTFARFEKTFYPYVVANMPKFRQTWSPMGSIKGAQQWESSFDYESQIVDRLANAAELVILTSHLKAESIGNVKTGRFIPDNKKPLVKNTHMRLFLRQSPKHAAPIGLVLKRISKRVFTDSGMQVMNVFPRKIDPCTWETIENYWNNPVGDREPLPNETPDEYEISIISGMMTADQRKTMELFVKAGASSEEELSEVSDSVIQERVKALAGEGKSPPQIAVDLGIEITEVIKHLSI